MEALYGGTVPKQRYVTNSAVIFIVIPVSHYPVSVVYFPKQSTVVLARTIIAKRTTGHLERYRTTVTTGEIIVYRVIYTYLPTTSQQRAENGRISFRLCRYRYTPQPRHTYPYAPALTCTHSNTLDGGRYNKNNVTKYNSGSHFLCKRKPSSHT